MAERIPQESSPRPECPPVDAATLEGYMSSLSNWGRWGDDDELGTLNLVGPEQRLAAIGTVRSGELVSCARGLDLRRESGPPAPMHFMTATGERAPEQGYGMAVDWFGLTSHGSHVTHLDAHSHVFWNARTYNDRPARMVTTWGRARVGAVDAAAQGIVTRGVLLDVPRHRGVTALEAGSPIGAAELQACARAQGVDIQEGDALLVRTNRDEALPPAGRVGDEDPGPLLAGLHASALPWLHERGVALLVSDAISDVQPSQVRGVRLPVHAVALVAMGLWLVDNATLEELAGRAEARGAHDFMFGCLPLPIERGTGSPVNPVALL